MRQPVLAGRSGNGCGRFPQPYIVSWPRFNVGIVGRPHYGHEGATRRISAKCRINSRNQWDHRVDKNFRRHVLHGAWRNVSVFPLPVAAAECRYPHRFIYPPVPYVHPQQLPHPQFSHFRIEITTCQALQSSDAKVMLGGKWDFSSVSWDISAGSSRGRRALEAGKEPQNG